MRPALAIGVGCLFIGCCFVSLRASAWQERPRDPAELNLEGIIVSPSASLSVALLRREGAAAARAVRVGETLYGFRLVEVTENAAILERDGERFRLTLARQTGRAGAAAGPTPLAARSSDAGTVHSSRVETARRSIAGADGSWFQRDLERAVAAARLAKEMPVILAETGITPRVQEGEVRGFRITRLPEGTLLSEVGLLPGDVVLSIDGEPLSGNLSTLIRFYPRLLAESEIRVEIEREGEIVRLLYRLR